MMFEQKELSQTEQDLVADMLTNAAMVKYLALLRDKMAYISATGVVEEGQTAEDFLRRRAQVQGAMEAFNTLLQPSSQSFNQE